MATQGESGNKLWKAVWSEPIQAFGGFLMTGVGVALGFSGTWEKVLGSVLVASGGILVTSPVAAAYGKENALGDIKKRLVSLNQLIATISGQIETATDEHEYGHIDKETLARVISNSLQYLTTAGSQIQEIVGSSLDSGALTQTAKDFKLVQAALDSAKTRATQSGDTKTAEAIRDAQTKLEVFADKLGSLTEVETIKVLCPYCASPNEVIIGKAGGSSQMPSCTSCFKRFHAHRKSDGGVFVKQRGAISDILCPNCGDTHAMKIKPGSTTPVHRWCLNCYAKQFIDPVEGVVTSTSLDAPADVEIIRTDNSGYAISECPDCGSEARAFAMRGAYTFSACYGCDNLLRMINPDAQQSV